jgi:hypothetical protein
MPLFTFFAEYKQGTYVGQVEAADYKAAPYAWAAQLDVSAIEGLDSTSWQDVTALMKTYQSEGEIVGLTDTHNVWCLSAVVEDSLLLVHYVLTEESK